MTARGNPDRHESERKQGLELVDGYAEYAREGAAFDDMAGASERFLDRKSVTD